jgi:glycosyltransferase involved in cell wall biosynthesis
MLVAHVSIIHKPLDTRVFRKQCRALAAAGYDVHLIVGGAPLEALDGVQFHSIAASYERPPLRRQLPRVARAARVAFALGASVYHLHDPHLIPLGLALKLRGARVIYDVHEDYPAKAATEHSDHLLRKRLKAGTWTVLEHLARKWLDSFVCASQALATRFPADRTVVVSNLPLHQEFTPATAVPQYHDRPNTVLYVGSLTRARGYFEITRALELLPAELDCTLRVVGYFRDQGVVRAASTLPPRGRIEMIPFQPYERVVREMLSAKIGIVLLHPLPNHADPARSNKLFEYMAAGLPVIASDHRQWRDIVRGIGCGLVVDPLDATAIAGAVEYLLTHPADAEAMGRRGRDAVCSGLNWDCDRARLVAFYRRLTADRTGTTAGTVRADRSNVAS